MAVLQIHFIDNLSLFYSGTEGISLSESFLFVREAMFDVILMAACMLHKCNHAFSWVDKISVNEIKTEEQLMSAGDQLYIRIIIVFQSSPCIKHVKLVFWHVVSAI